MAKQPEAGLDLDSMIEEDGESTTAVAIREEGGIIVAPAPVYSENPDFDQDDLQWPRLRLAQGLTQEVTEGLAKPGQWILLGEDPVDEVLIVPMSATKQREYRPNSDDRPECTSPDGRQGFGIPGGDCATCPLSQWVQMAKGEKNQPPPCQLFYSYVAYSVTHHCLVEFRARKTSMAIGKTINTFMKARGGGTFAMKLGRQTATNPRKQTYYVPTGQKVVVPPEVLEEAREAYSG